MITGEYTITAGEKTYTSKNIITLLGESFFLNRMLNNKLNPIEYIVFGNSRNTPERDDMGLGNETVRKKAVKKADIENHSIILTCSCTIEEIEGTSEIGVATDDILISHDIYELEEDFINPSVNSVEIKYTLKIGV